MVRQRQMLDRPRDPLSEACAPPADETQAQRAAREAKEVEARRVSEKIDEQIKLENRHKKTPVKVLLLGQEGSGASSLTISHTFLLLLAAYLYCRHLYGM